MRGAHRGQEGAQGEGGPHLKRGFGMSQRQWVEPMTVAHSFPRERGRWEQGPQSRGGVGRSRACKEERTEGIGNRAHGTVGKSREGSCCCSLCIPRERAGGEGRGAIRSTMEQGGHK